MVPTPDFRKPLRRPDCLATIAIGLSARRDGKAVPSDSSKGRNQSFCVPNLDNPNLHEIAGEFQFCANAPRGFGAEQCDAVTDLINLICPRRQQVLFAVCGLA
jgi:hypothetical protein